MSESNETIRPICANRKHAIKPGHPFLPWRCGFPPLGDIIRGNPVECFTRRLPDNLCGFNGRFFEEKS